MGTKLSGVGRHHLEPGDSVDGWRLTWSFPTGRSVAQAWNASVARSGAAANASWNGAIDANGTASFGLYAFRNVNDVRENAPQCSEPFGRF